MCAQSRSRCTRDYAPVLASLRELAPDASREVRMKAVVDAIWKHLGGDGAGREISWIGFYAISADRSEMTLLERRDKPACSPIGLHGVCGRAWRERKTLIVDDIKSLGEDYVACDPRDASELVVPCFDDGGECWGVLDADSFAVGAFDEHDAKGMVGALVAADLTHASQPDIARV